MPRSMRARAAACTLVVGFALMPHLLRALTADWFAEGSAAAIGRTLLFFVCVTVAAACASGHRTWGALHMDELSGWANDTMLFVGVGVALFLPAALLDQRTPALAPALAGVLLPAAVEEFAFRGVLTVSLIRLLSACKARPEFRPALAVLLSSVAFAAAHDVLLTPDRSLAAALQRGTAGLLLGFVSLRSRSLLAPMFAHAAFNAVVLAPWFD
jgi:membrane protease YdiL (CAAX protease family)